MMGAVAAVGVGVQKQWSCLEEIVHAISHCIVSGNGGFLAAVRRIHKHSTSDRN